MNDATQTAADLKARSRHLRRELANFEKLSESDAAALRREIERVEAKLAAMTARADMHMRCLCGTMISIRETGKPGCARAECTTCHEVYDYSCWLLRTNSQQTFHKIEAFPRGATALGRDLAGRCQECAACQEWLMQPSSAPRCTGQEYRKRGIIEKGKVAR